MRKLFIICFCITLISQLSFAQKQILLLQQCVDTALARNRNVKQQAIEIKNKGIVYDQARKNLLPTVSFDASHTLNFGRTLGENNTYLSNTAIANNSTAQISTNVVLFNGFKLLNTIKMKDADRLASQADMEKIKFTITTNVVADYLQVLLNKELLQLATNQLQLTRAKIEQRKVLIDNGRLPEGDLLELYSQEAKEELREVQAGNNLKLSVLDLSQIMEVDDFENLELVVPKEFETGELKLSVPEQNYESIISHRPEIKAAEYRLKNSEYALTANYSGYFPTLSLTGNIGTAYYTDNSEVKYNSFGQQFSDKINGGFMLTLSVPLFDKFITRNNIRSAKLAIESSRIGIEDAKIQISKSIQQAYYDALNAKNKWEAANKSVLAATESNRFADQKYDAGKASLYELYQAKTNLTQALSEQIQAKYEYLFKIKLLDLFKL